MGSMFIPSSLIQLQNPSWLPSHLHSIFFFFKELVHQVTGCYSVPQCASLGRKNSFFWLLIQPPTQIDHPDYHQWPGKVLYHHFLLNHLHCSISRWITTFRRVEKGWHIIPKRESVSNMLVSSSFLGAAHPDWFLISIMSSQKMKNNLDKVMHGQNWCCWRSFSRSYFGCMVFFSVHHHLHFKLLPNP